MANYRAIIHYHFKKGMEDKGIKFLENELIKKAQEYGCHGIELWQNEKNPSTLVGIGHWNSLQEARNFQAHWDSKEREFMHYCTTKPEREFYKIKSTYSEKVRKAA